VQTVGWSLTTECTPPDQETSERRPYAPQGATGGKLTNYMWCGIMHGSVTGPFVFAENTVTVDIYLHKFQ
jgi:hypothetical protein